MRAIVYDQYGPPDVLRLTTIDDPAPGPGQVRVRVEVAGVNPVDAKQRRGDFATLAPAHFPQQLGNEYAGTIDAIAPDVTSLRVGDAVLGSAAACAYAEYVVVSATDVVHKPDTMPWTAAGTLPAAGQTAHSALAALGVQAGDTVLIHGAAGGVGTIAVQLARLAGTTVIATGSPANHDYLRALGATPTTYGPGLTDRVHSLAPRGVDAALDLVGGDAITASLALVTDRSRIGTTVDTDAVTTHGIQRVGGRSTTALRELTELYQYGKLQLLVDHAFPLDEAAQAHTLIETGHGRGKIALQVS